MSSHDLVVIAASVVVTLVLLDRFGHRKTSPRAIFGFEVDNAPALERVLTAEEFQYFKEQKMWFPRVEIRFHFGEEEFQISYERDGKVISENRKYPVTNPLNPVEVWTCYLAEEAPAGTPPSRVMGFIDRPRLVVQCYRGLRKIDVGMRGGRFGDTYSGVLKKEHILASIPLDASKLRAMDPEIHRKKKEDPFRYWDFIVSYQDENMRWSAACSDIEAFANRWRFL